MLRKLKDYHQSRTKLRRGVCFLNAGMYDAALEALTEAARLNPNGDSLPRFLAAAHLGNGDYRAAAEQFEQAITNEQRDINLRIRHALSLWQWGDSTGAIDAFRHSLKRFPESDELHFQLGVMLAAQEEFEEAELRFTQAMVIEPTHHEALVHLAMCYGAQGRLPEAVRMLRRAQRIRPNDPRIVRLLAQAARSTRDKGHIVTVNALMPEDNPTQDEQAIAELSTLIESEPDFVDAFLSLPSEDLDTEVFAMLAATVRRALDRQPEHADLHFHCGRVLHRLGQSDDAINEFEHAVNIKPDFVAALIQLARMYQQTDRYEDARKRLEMALATGVQYADVYYLLGTLYQAEGETDRAKRAYHDALRINDNYQDAQEALARLSV